MVLNVMFETSLHCGTGHQLCSASMATEHLWKSLAVFEVDGTSLEISRNPGLSCSKDD